VPLEKVSLNIEKINRSGKQVEKGGMIALIRVVKNEKMKPVIT